MPVQQHPVPQQISSYEFRLVGDMTLKQFGYLAGGVVIALFFYGLPIAAFLKWPLVLLSGFLGFAFAFMPIEERPLTTWLLAFIKAVFSPTLFVWQKKPRKPEIFEPIVSKISLLTTPAAPPDKEQLARYLKTLSLEKTKSPLDQKEEEFLQQIASLFPASQISPKPIKPPTFTLPIKEIPEAPKVKESEAPKRPPQKIPKPPIEAYLYPDWRKKMIVRAKTTKELPIPTPPSIPNIITGMVLDKNGEIIEGAILEIRNEQGIPVRALRTNKIGQFTIATPLENGSYEIEIEKEGYKFDIIKFEAKGEIINPIEIRAK